MDEKKRIYIIEDEEEIVDFVTEYLKAEGYEVEAYHRGDTGLKAVIDSPPDLLILDIMLPGLNGMNILKKMRESLYLPVILLTSRVDEVDRVLGIEMGADDYITKPFSPRELVVRVKSIFRRINVIKQEMNQTKYLMMGKIKLDMENRKISSGNRESDLTSTEFNILKQLVKNPGRIFSREELLDHIWGDEFSGETRTIDVHIKNLRKKLSEIGGIMNFIHSVRGVGYKYED